MRGAVFQLIGGTRVLAGQLPFLAADTARSNAAEITGNATLATEATRTSHFGLSAPADNQNAFPISLIIGNALWLHMTVADGTFKAFKLA